MRLLVLALLVVLGGGGEGVEVIQTPDSPVTIESASLGLDETATSVVTIRARGTSGPVDSFKVRIVISSASGKVRGFASRVLGNVDTEARPFVVTLNEWFVEDTDHVKVMVVARRSRQTDPVPNETYCGSNFCVEERKACISSCGVGCLARFSCKLGTTCESDCFCKSTPACGG